MAMVYEWKADSRFPIAAQIAAERLQEIKERNGRLTPHSVIKDASSEKSPIHKCFEWNDGKAAEEYRLWQARKLIGAIIVLEVNDTPLKHETRAFVHVGRDEDRRYEDISVAFRQPELREQVLARAKAEILAWRHRYRALEEFAAVFDAIDAATAPTKRRRRGPGESRLGVAG